MRTLSRKILDAVIGGVTKPWNNSMSDGCTLAPDGTWHQACVTHDKAYYYGGSAAQRLAADQRLRTDMIKQGAPHWVAGLYYHAVRIAGRPGTGLPWQWGFGNNH